MECWDENPVRLWKGDGNHDAGYVKRSAFVGRGGFRNIGFEVRPTRVSAAGTRSFALLPLLVTYAARREVEALDIESLDAVETKIIGISR